MPSKSYTTISSFWYLGVPAAVLGLGYFMWNSHGFVAMQVRAALSPFVAFVGQLFNRLV